MILDSPFTVFTEVLGSKEPVPGGGGAAAAAGALAAALGSMVASLTTGKKKYAVYEEDIQRILKDTDRLRKEFLALADADAERFRPLSEAYRLPKNTPEEIQHRTEVMEVSLGRACEAPLAMMKAAMETLALLAELTEKGSTLAVSDVGAGAAMARACLQAASLNIYINTGMMQDREKAVELNEQADRMNEAGCAQADAILGDVMRRIRK
ncbi:MAG: cyclodeaminase/cyclohydrolase family protein [Solobacterium sp.]|nr:cyclodeaminase/cyclohydrolase family protein [Solobacterium sp.]